MNLRYISTLLSALLVSNVDSFAPLKSTRSISSSLEMAGMGMGMGGGVATKQKKGGAKKKKTQGGAKFDVSKAVLKSEKLYDELQRKEAKAFDKDDDNIEFITAEYMITARIKPNDLKNVNVPGAAAVSDWVPVAQLSLKRHVNEPGFENHIRDCERVRTAISYYCREISHIAILGSSIFKSIPRNNIEYAAEPVDSFHKFVYEDIIEGKNQDEENDNTMSKSEARSVLDLEEGCTDKGEIKSAYRKLSFKLHPDRFVGKGRSEEEIKQASEDFGKVKLAYESMSSGVRDSGSGGNQSWYESLGGRARTDFAKLQLRSLEDAKKAFEGEKYESAVAGIRPETVMTFVTRNQAASR